MQKKNKRRICIVVTAQTAHNLKLLADMAGLKTEGQVVDKLTRDRMVYLRRQERAQEHRGEKEVNKIGFVF